MKKIISFILCLCLFLGICPIPAAAEDSVQMKYIKVMSGEGTKTYPCLWDSKGAFCSPDVLAEMTDFVAFPMDDSYDVEFYRNYEGMKENLYYEKFLKVAVTVNENSADIEVMNQSYTVDCYVRDETLYLPLEKLLYLLHADWEIMDDSLFVTPLAYTILDFWALHQEDLARIESEQEDTLIETGWLGDDSIFWQSVYSSLSGVFSDFDGKIFLGTWTEEGGFDHLVTQEYYKDAILQLARDDIEYVSEDAQKDALKSFVNSSFSVSNGSINEMKDILAIGANISDVIDSTEDAVEVLEQIQEKFPSLKVSDKLKNVAEKIENGEIDTSFLHIPELDSKVKELSAAGDALSILQCVWDAYDLADTVSGLDDKYIEEIKILQDYEYWDDMNENVIDYVKSSARILIEAHEDPTSAGITAGIENALALLLSTTFQESPQGKALSVIGAVGNCCGIVNVDLQETYDTYAELGHVTYSIKVEQLVQRLIQFNPLHYVEEELTTDKLAEVRNQLMLYLKLNLRNKSKLYDLNVKGNQNENWSSTDEAKALYNEIVLDYTMLVELTNTKDYDSDIILSDNIEDLNSVYPAVTEEILLDEKINSEDVWKEFINSGQYKSYITEGNVLSAEYVIYDINKDENTELLIETTSEAPFYYTWLFTLEGNEVILVYENYGYGQFRYSPTYNAVLVSPETRPFSGTGVTPFYQLEGSNFNHKFTIMQDMGENYYSDITGEKSISDEERNKYFADVVQFEWSKIPLSQDTVSSKKDLSAYLGGDITEIVSMIGNMHDSGATDGSKEYTNGVIIVSQFSTERGVNYISINGESEYSIRGIEYGMSMDDATAIAYADAAQLKDDLPYYKSFLLNDGNTISFHSEDEAFVDSINIFMAE